MEKKWRSVTVTFRKNPEKKDQRTLTTFLNSNAIGSGEFQVVESGVDGGIPYIILMIYVIQAALIGYTELSGF
jgi:hypothetical protein